MKRTTLLLILAALTASSCSLERNSQYGLRWDRRLYAPQRAANEIKVPDTAPKRTPTVRTESASASVEAAAFSVNPEVEALHVATIGPETLPDAVPAQMADAEFTLDNFRKFEADVAPITDEALPIHPFAKKSWCFSAQVPVDPGPGCRWAPARLVYPDFHLVNRLDFLGNGVGKRRLD